MLVHTFQHVLYRRSPVRAHVPIPGARLPHAGVPDRLSRGDRERLGDAREGRPRDAGPRRRQEVVRPTQGPPIPGADHRPDGQEEGGHGGRPGAAGRRPGFPGMQSQ